jgi:hypothetical protein
MVLSSAAANLPGTLRPLPLSFEENRGQISAPYAYFTHYEGLHAGFLPNRADLLVPESKGKYRKLSIRLLRGSASPVGVDQQAGRSNYLRGANASRWVRGAANYKKIEYPDLYPGISLLFYGNGNRLEHDFRIEPGANPSQIAFQIDGAKRIALSSEGDLNIYVGGCALTLQKPTAYQYVSGERKEVDAGFLLANDGTVSFRIGNYSAASRLIIDPVFVFSTYLGGSGSDAIAAVATDSEGYIYVTGTTSSVDFPTANAEQPQLNGAQNLFVTKLDPTGAKLIYSTYLGGSDSQGADQSSAIVIDGNGNAIIAGITSSRDFPFAGAIQSPNCPFNASCYFLASISPDGSHLNYAGEIGGEAADLGSDGLIALDSSADVYLAGNTSSPNFPITPGTLSSSVPGYPYSTLFVLKVDPTGRLLYSTVITGNSVSGAFVPSGIAVDATGQATVVGTASSGLSTTGNVIQPTFPNSSASTATAGFILQLNATASKMNYSSYLPGTDGAGGFAVDPKGDIYIAGATAETNLPVSANAYERKADSGYVMELSAGAATVKAATYFKCCLAYPPYTVNAIGIALDSNSNVFIGGETEASSFPLMYPFTPVFEFTESNSEMALAELNPGLTTLLFGSFLSSTDAVFPGSTFSGLAVDKSNDLIVAGKTMAYDFPTTPGSFQPQLPSSQNPLNSTVSATFISKIDLAPAAPSACLDAYSENFTPPNALPTLPGKSKTATINLTNCGNAPLHLSSITSSDPSFTAAQSCGVIAAGTSCPVTVTFAPVRAGTLEAVISFEDDSAIPLQKVIVSGRCAAPAIGPVPNPVFVGNQVVGTQGSTSFVLTNEGNASLEISGISVTGSSYSASYSCAPPTTLYATTCTITVGFAPQEIGTITGSLLLSSNDPENPQFVVNLSGIGDSAYQVPSVSYIYPGTGPISTPVNINIYGSNFYPASVVYVNGASQTTTYLNSTELQFTLAASALVGTGQVPITVVNPSPGGTSNQVTFAPYQVLSISPAALAYVPSTGLLYAAIPAWATSNQNTVIPVTPSTGVLGTPIAVGNDPVLLSPSSDGQYLYVALATDQTVQRINLKTQAIERTFPYATCSSCASIAATDLQSVPGSPQEVVLAQGPMLSLYNDNGLVNSVPSNPGRSADPQFSSIAFAGNDGIYALPLTYASCLPNVATIGPSGLAYTRVGGSNTCTNVGQDGGTLISDGTLLYAEAGEVWDPTTMTVKATVPVPIANVTVGTPNGGTSHNMALDPSLKNFYIVGNAFSAPDAQYEATLFSFSTQSLEAVSQLTFQNLTDPSVGNLVRWGSDGFTFTGPSAGQTNTVLYLVRSGLASSQFPNPMPSLSALSPAFESSEAMVYDETLTVTGTNFVPSSVIQWNGTPLPTSFNSATQLSATIGANQLKTVGTYQVTVVNPAPGGGTSNALPFTFGLLEPTASPSSTSIDFGSVPIGTSATKYITLSNNGWAILNISSIAASGEFSSTSTCTSNLVYLGTEATCEIALVFSPTSSGLQTGTLTITDTAPGGPQTISLTGTGAGTLLNSSVSVTPSAQVITDAQSLTITAAVIGTGVAGTPTGTITLTAGSYSAQLQLNDASAKFTVPAGSLNVGSDSVTALYSGDTVYEQASGTASVTVSEVALTMSPALPVPAGGNTSSTATISVGSSYSGTLQLTCALTASPTGAQDLPTCALNPPSVSLTRGGAASSTLTIYTTASPSAALARPSKLVGTRGAVLAIMVLLGIPRCRRAKTLLLLCLVVLPNVGCGGSSSSSNVGTSNPGTTPGTYTFIVTGMDSVNAKITSSSTVKITVQ